MRRKTKVRLAGQTAAKHHGTPGQVLMRAARTAGLDRHFADKAALERLEPAPSVEERVASPVLPALVAEAHTVEQRAVAEAGDRLRALMRQPRFRAILNGMISARQQYALWYREWQEALAEEKDVPLLTEDLLVGAAMHRAAQPFTEHDLVQALISDTLPALADVIDKHTARDAEATLADRADKDKERRARALPIGFKHSPDCAEPVLARDRPLVLVGWEPALLWLVDQVVRALLAAKEPCTVVRLMDSVPKEAPHQRVIRLGPSAWLGCCNSNTSLALCMGTHVADKLTYQPDLLVCDALDKAFTRSFVGRPRAASAGDANKQFAKWCAAGGCAMLGLLGTDEKEYPDIRAPEYEQLRIFTWLRPVCVLDVEDKYHIVVHHDAARFEVAKSEVDAYTRGAIIQPERAAAEIEKG